ncbi:cd7 antigen-like isoform X2 [Embiotoca jacksoni]|uniref:cd7 antigen-like isoform X2 n=1 Tax=Embiotoca jacksoni TaxID=100190 RepID=UPI0037049E51
MMTGIQCLVCLWTLLISQTGFVCSDVRFLERREGESVVLPCVLEQKDPAPFGVYLRRSWLSPGELLFVYSGSPVSVTDDASKNRTSVSGDPSLGALNVTISQLRAGDTDRYCCDFVVDNPAAEDIHIHGLTEFFLLVSGGGDGHESVDMDLVETCAGGSAVLPCFSPHGEGLAVEGVSLKRRRGRAPVEVLYNSKRHRSSSSSSSSRPPQFPAERVQLSSAPSPGGLTYNLTLQQLQPEDSALYSCQLLLRDTPERSTSLGRRVVFVSVKGEECSCSAYSAALYALSSAVALFLLLLLLIALVAIYKGKARRRVKSHPAAPIYEEMTGLQPLGGKVAPRRWEEAETSEYRNYTVKKSCPGNHYESPSGDLRPRSESHT